MVLLVLLSQSVTIPVVGSLSGNELKQAVCLHGTIASPGYFFLAHFELSIRLLVYHITKV